MNPRNESSYVMTLLIFANACRASAPLFQCSRRRKVPQCRWPLMVETNKPTTTIVANGPYGVTRNPIYIGMFLEQTGLAIGFDNLWILATLVSFYLVIRYGVIAREEVYLERKFGAVYLGYKSRVRRWL
jgi:protein-S-isoprenylcysteine O-methyltransferase Ste14